MADYTPPTEEDMQFMGAILTASVSQTQAATNAVISNERRNVYEHAKALVNFYTLVDKAAEHITTRELDSILAKYEWRVESARRFIETYESEQEA